MTEPRYCEHVEDDCLAPPAFRVGGLGGGVGVGTASCRATCYGCGLPVCSNCGIRVTIEGVGRKRIGKDCLPSALHRAYGPGGDV